MFGTSVDTNPKKIDDLLGRYVQAVFPSVERVKQILSSGEKLRFYLGIDPTGPDIHLGHSTNFFVLKKLIELGHEVILLIGDFTALIGDPSGKDAARRALSPEEIKANMETYLKQVLHILPKGQFKLKYNGEWLGKLSFTDVIKLASHFTQQQMIVRDMFQERLKAERPIYLNEFLYPLAQGYDSVAMEVDGEIGGNDQTFNMLVGRTLSKEMLGKDKIVLTTWLLEDPITKKKIMNKSEGKLISLNDKPADMFGKVMAMNDSAIIPLFEYTTEVSTDKLEEVKARLKTENPITLKKELAFELVKLHHGEKEAQKVSEEFNQVFSKRELPEDIEEFSGEGKSILDFIADNNLAESRSDAKRLLEQKAVKVNSVTVTDWGQTLSREDIIQVGPRKFAKVSQK
ncbi:MAG: tyrosine--tRNA ligase [Patescibacteria group bacterium]